MDDNHLQRGCEATVRKAELPEAGLGFCEMNKEGGTVQCASVYVGLSMNVRLQHGAIAVF